MAFSPMHMKPAQWLCAVAALTFAPAAVALDVDGEDEVVSAKVEVAVDLNDLMTTDGQVAVRQALEGAARVACRKVATHSPVTPHAEATCRRESVEAAMADLINKQTAFAARD